MSEQDRQLARVLSRIERAVVAYVEAVPVGDTFRTGELESDVCGSACCTPGSPSRILRVLRKRGVLNYEIANRGQALCRRIALEEPKQLDLLGVA